MLAHRDDDARGTAHRRPAARSHGAPPDPAVVGALRTLEAELRATDRALHELGRRLGHPDDPATGRDAEGRSPR